MTATPRPAYRPMPIPRIVHAIDFKQHLLASTMFLPVGLAHARSFPRSAIAKIKEKNAVTNARA